MSDNEKGDLAFSSDLSSKFAVSISEQFCLVSKPGLSYLSYKQQQFWAGHLTTVMFFEQWSQLGLNTDVRTNLLIHMLNFVCTLKVPNLGVGCSWKCSLAVGYRAASPSTEGTAKVFTHQYHGNAAFLRNCPRSRGRF